MSITNYSELQTDAASWIARSDLTSSVPDFITLFESWANRKIRTRQMMVTQSTTPSSGQFDLPSDYLAWKRVTDVGSIRTELEYVDPSYLAIRYPDSPASAPVCFTVDSSTSATSVVKIMGTSSTLIDFEYFQKITALSTANTSNWLLTAHPDIYLAGTLVEANMFCKDYETAAIWKGRRDEQLDEISKLDQKTRGPSAIRVVGRTP